VKVTVWIARGILDRAARNLDVVGRAVLEVRRRIDRHLNAIRRHLRTGCVDRLECRIVRAPLDNDVPGALLDVLVERDDKIRFKIRNRARLSREDR
jgi:hypothetical protein